MSAATWKAVSRWISAIGVLLCALLALWGWKLGVLTSRQAMADLVSRAGAAGTVLFTLFQAVQVAIPVLPGGLGCLVGVVVFGPVVGFVCSYTGICIGSMLAFGVAKSFGRPLLPKLFSEKTIQRYEHWTGEESHFARLFALAIFLPVAPDDFLCYLAGTTSMSWRRFTAIIWLCKPFSVSLYSLGLTAVWERIVPLFFR